MRKKKCLRSSNDAKAWKCRKCGTINRPTTHMFFKLPAFRCSNAKCRRKFNGNFKFCLGEVEAEKKSIIGEVLDQEKSTYCASYAYAKTVEIMERVANIANGKDPDTVLPGNPDHLQLRFEEKYPEVPSNDSLTKDFGVHRVLHMGLILRSEGILKDDSGTRYIAPDVSTIARDDFEEICHKLANGYAMVATMFAGKRRSRLRYCQIYKLPSLSRFRKKKARYGHAVVLIGAGIKKGKKFFYYLNSWGKKFCPRKNIRGEIVRGGIGKVRATDLTKNVVLLSHPHETGGERSLKDQNGFDISGGNYVLMIARKNQVPEAEGKMGETQEKRFLKFRDDHLNGAVFRDDEMRQFYQNEFSSMKNSEHFDGSSQEGVSCSQQIKVIHNKHFKQEEYKKLQSELCVEKEDLDAACSLLSSSTHGVLPSLPGSDELIGSLLHELNSLYSRGSLLHLRAAWVCIEKLLLQLLLGPYNPNPAFESAFMQSHVLEKISLLELGGKPGKCHDEQKIRSSIDSYELGAKIVKSLIEYRRICAPSLDYNNYNTYKDPNPLVLFIIVERLTVFQDKARYFLDEWPGHPGLLKLLDIIASLLAMPMTTPLSKALLGLRLLVGKAQTLQENYSKFLKELETVAEGAGVRGDKQAGEPTINLA